MVFVYLANLKVNTVVLEKSVPSNVAWQSGRLNENERMQYVLCARGYNIESRGRWWLTGFIPKDNNRMHR